LIIGLLFIRTLILLCQGKLLLRTPVSDTSKESL